MTNENYTYSGWKMNGFLALFMILAMIAAAIASIAMSVNLEGNVVPSTIAAVVGVLLIISSIVVMCGFMMLVSSAYMQSMSAFVAQNIGAQKFDRARRALFCGILSSLVVGVIMGFFSFFYGDLMAGIFSKDVAVTLAAAEYMKAYAIDCLFTSFLFCFIGYFNGCGNTVFVMIQGLIGAFGIRVPISWLVSKYSSNLFYIGLATPASTVIQIILCGAFLLIAIRIQKKKNELRI